MSIGVIILDRYPLMRLGIQTALEMHRNVNVVCSTADPVEAMRAESPAVHVAFVESSLCPRWCPARSNPARRMQTRLVLIADPGATSTREKCRPDLILSREVEPRELQRAVAKLLPATRTAAASSRLSTRELEIASKLAAGLSTREIAQTLHISSNTVRTHLAHIAQKLHVRRQAEIVRWWHLNRPAQGGSTG